MSVVIPAGYCQATYRWSLSGTPRQMVNVMGHQIAATDASTPDQIATSLGARWLSALSALQKSVITFVDVTVVVGTGTFPLVGSAAINTAGAAGGDPNSINTAVLVKKNTPSGGRPNQGRIYVPGMVSETNTNTNGTIVAGQLTTLQTAFTQWWANCNGAFAPSTQTYPMRLLHGDTSPVATPTSITGLTVQQVVGTQRRRMRS